MILEAGVDEVGRGPLAGDVVTAAVILHPDHPISGLNDSKKLSEKKREYLFDRIKDHCISWAIGRASVAEIDELNILRATLLAMQRAVAQLDVRPQKIWVDGNHCPDFGLPAESVIGGDGKVACISAASILAKVLRDKEMEQMEIQYPGYGFAKHKGYGTKVHMQALEHLGACAIHRQSFAPVSKVIRAKIIS